MLKDKDQRFAYRSPTASQVGASGNSVGFSQSLAGSVQSSWQPSVTSQSLHGFFQDSRPSSISFPTTAPSLRPAVSPMPERAARVPQRMQNQSGEWKPVLQSRTDVARNPVGSRVLSSQEDSDARARPGSVALQHSQLRQSGNDLGPQVSRASRQGMQPIVQNNRREVLSQFSDDKPSLASWSLPPSATGTIRSSVEGSIVQPSPAGRRQASPSPPMSQGLLRHSESGVPAGRPLSPAFVNNRRMVGLQSGGMLQASPGGMANQPMQGVKADDDDLPTLKELVQVGTAGAASSTSAARPPGMQGTWTFAQQQQQTGSYVGAAPSGQLPGPAQALAGPSLPHMTPPEEQKSMLSNKPKEPGQLVVALDVDEVLCQYVDGFRMFMQRERPSGPLDTDSIFHEAHNPNSPWRLQFALSGGLDNLEAVPGAAAALRRLRNAGVRLEAVTSRPPIMRESTEALLLKLFPVDTFDAAHFVGPGEKGVTCNQIGARALVDDQLPNCVDACQCGVVSVLFDFCGSYPWSKNVTELPARCKRIETWAETCNFLLLALGVDPLEHSTQASEYLLGIKEVTVGRENIADDYMDALSEAGKQPTEYDGDLDAPTDIGRDHMQARVAQEQSLRSEPWWHDNHAPQSSVEATLDPNSGKPFGMMDPAQQDELRQKLLHQQQLQQIQQQQQIMQLNQLHQLQQQHLHNQQAALEQQQHILSNPAKGDSMASREPLHAWNSSSGFADSRHDTGLEKGQAGASNGFVNAEVRLNREPYQGMYQGSTGLSASRPGEMRRELAESPVRARRDDEDQQGCVVA